MNAKDSELISCLAVYGFLRSFSYYLHLSPFEVESFIAALDSNINNPLIDQIHYVLLKCIAEQYNSLRMYEDLDAKLFSVFGWATYVELILANVHKFMKKNSVPSVQDGDQVGEIYGVQLITIESIIDLVRRNKMHNFEYYTYSFADKVAVLDCLVGIICSFGSVVDNIDIRESAPRKVRKISFPRNKTLHLSYTYYKQTLNINQGRVDALPLFTKGDDGSVEVCILCGLEGICFICLPFM